MTTSDPSIVGGAGTGSSDQGAAPGSSSTTASASDSGAPATPATSTGTGSTGDGSGSASAAPADPWAAVDPARIAAVQARADYAAARSVFQNADAAVSAQQVVVAAEPAKLLQLTNAKADALVAEQATYHAEEQAFAQLVATEEALLASDESPEVTAANAPGASSTASAPSASSAAPSS